MDYSPPIITSKKPNIGKAFVEKTVLNPPSNPLTHEIHLNQQQSSSWVHLVKSHKVAILTVILVIITCYFGPKIYSKYVSHKSDETPTQYQPNAMYSMNHLHSANHRPSINHMHHYNPMNNMHSTNNQTPPGNRHKVDVQTMMNYPSELKDKPPPYPHHHHHHSKSNDVTTSRIPREDINPLITDGHLHGLERIDEIDEDIE